MNYRIGNGSAIVLLMLAVVNDGLSIIPIIGGIFGGFHWILVSIYLSLRGFKLINARRLTTTALSFIAEVLPVIQILPTLTLGTAAIIFMTRMEDKRNKGMKGGNPNKKSSRIDDRATDSNVQQQDQPLYVDGVREPVRNTDLRPVR
jgi:hypothetical protein